METYFAHIRPDGEKQTVQAHLRDTGALCGDFASRFGERERGELMGCAHDIGKLSNAFQRRLAGGPKVDHATAGALECMKKKDIVAAGCVAGHHSGLPDFGNHAFQRRLAGGPKVDHATAGALECMKKKDIVAAGCVAGHHSGLPDFGNPRVEMAGSSTLAGRLKKRPGKDIPEYDWHEELPDPGAMPRFGDPYSISFLTKMLYSCLVDADFLDTERFMGGGTVARGDYDELPVLMERLQAYVRPWFPAKTELNEKRCRILERCVDSAEHPQGLFTLTVPTGGGKTVASLAFALRHALKHGMERVIYVIPYTSIIEQNADVFRKILGEKNVVEHHSGVLLDEDDEVNSDNVRQRLATENWDAPVIVTTAVQFFESFYHNRSSQCRKLHNVANSVVIFDEAQMIPAGQLLPSVGVIAQLVRYFHTTAVLCTATQPVLDDLLRSFVPDLTAREICPDREDLYRSFRRVSYRNTTAVLCTATQPVLDDLLRSFVPDLTAREICPDREDLYRSFRRVSYRNRGKLSHEALCRELAEHKQVLCIVNTRQEAQKVFEDLPDEGKFHLSTLMHPNHRRATLSEVRRILKSGGTCRLVSTSLIEAGVDVDFPAVYRELAGLDSIAQAAGRCNREGKRPADSSIVTYFETERPAPLLQQVNIGAAREALADGDDPGDPMTMRRYFQSWRSLRGDNLDQSNAVGSLRRGIRGCSFPFETVAKNFHFIDQENYTVYIPQVRGDNLDQSNAVGSLRRGIRGCSFPFETVAKNFHFIDQENYTVYIPQGEGKELCERIRNGCADRKDYRKIGQFAVLVYKSHYLQMVSAGDVIPVHENAGVLNNLDLYRAETGLSLIVEQGKGEFI